MHKDSGLVHPEWTRSLHLQVRSPHAQVDQPVGVGQAVAAGPAAAAAAATSTCPLSEPFFVDVITAMAVYTCIPLDSSVFYRHVIQTNSECGCFDTVSRVAQHKTHAHGRSILGFIPLPILVFHSSSSSRRGCVSGSFTFSTSPLPTLSHFS